MVQDARQFERKPTKLSGHIRSVEDRDIDLECEIVELSAGGARIKVSNAGGLTGPVSLTIGKLGAYPATVIWSRPPLMGLQFQETPDVMAEVIMAVALYR